MYIPKKVKALYFLPYILAYTCEPGMKKAAVIEMLQPLSILPYVAHPIVLKSLVK